MFSAIKLSTNHANLVSEDAAVCHYVSSISGAGRDIGRKKWSYLFDTRQLIAGLSGKFQ